MAKQGSLLQIIRDSNEPPRVKLAMLFGALLEGGSWTGPWNVGDGGEAFGPFQIHPNYHNTTAAIASTPQGAFNVMRHNYEVSVSHIPESEWTKHPIQAYESAVKGAEMPKYSYFDSQGTATVEAKFARAAKAFGHNTGRTTGTTKASPGPAPASGSSGSAPVATSAGGVAQDVGLGGVGGDILKGATGLFGLGFDPLSMFNVSSWQDLAERTGLILLGALLVLIGVIVLVKDTGPGKAAVKAAPEAIGVAALA